MELVEISDLFKIEKGQLQSTKCCPGEYDFITAAAGWKTHNEYTHECEALIFAAAASGSLGRTHYVDGKFTTSDLCFILKPSKKYSGKINLRFYHAVFNILREVIVKNTATGTSKLAINRSNFSKYNLPYIELSQQNKFIKKLGKYQTYHEQFGNQYVRQIEMINQLRQAILQEAVQGKLVEQDPNDEPATELLKKIKAEKEQLTKEKKIKKGESLPSIKDNEIPYKLPRGWEWCRLQEVGLLERGKSKHRPRNDPRLFTNGAYPFVQTGDVAQGKSAAGMISAFSSKYNEVGLKQSRLWKQGTLCVTIAANIAETGFLGMDACFPDSVVGYTDLVATGTLPKYIAYYVASVKDHLIDFAPSTAQKNINLGILNILAFPMPPQNEQNRIVEKVGKLMRYCDKLEAKINQSKADSEKLMQAVLQEAFEN